ncbi:uncharacterized protein LOC127881852 isoform X3 [Dreissena polymorpha]|uniref:uncharacterized protein LOC127881852 isoform X3 n=2 Tax=Dreissena polymorpha TaxID=45954 RepID=UPI0022645477|nr:uncharacterized protein LOC127881852 isoform X3 [Dreissena polymorpha]
MILVSTKERNFEFNCRYDFQISFRTILTSAESPTSESDMDAADVHDGVGCDVCCERPIRGTRWKCRDCPNYDMCTSCYKNLRMFHDMNHSFKKINSHSFTGALLVNNKRSSKMHKVNRAGVVHKNVTCDVCTMSPIVGTRLKCRECANYDMCSACFEDHRMVHDLSHSFRQIETTGCVLHQAEATRTTSSQAVPKRIHQTNDGSGTPHVGVRCDVCKVSPIRGTRWRCSSCPDYDICSTCYEDKRRLHDKSHSFFKKENSTKRTKEQKGEHELSKTSSCLPSHWMTMRPDQHVIKVDLSTMSEEFRTVMGKFVQTLRKRIVRIHRVQSKILWEFYCSKRKQMEAIDGKIGGNEMNLFHGTKPDIIQTVCAHNLDMRLAGTNVGAIYGNGAYFASTADMSDRYATADPKTGHKFMLQCRVLVGRWTKGQQGLRRPPEIARTPDGQVRLYDSCVDNVRNPSIFCIFDHVQYYPEYIIEYK